MKGLFLTTENSATPAELITKIEGIFTDQNHKIVSEVFHTESDFEATTPESKAFASKLYKQLKLAQFLVVDLTVSNSSIGYVMSQAAAERKPILVLLGKGAKFSAIPYRASEGKLIKVKSYSKFSELESIVKEFMQYIRKKIDSKFILILPAEIEQYLDWVASERRLHKSQTVREAIERVIKQDKAYNTQKNS